VQRLQQKIRQVTTSKFCNENESHNGANADKLGHDDSAVQGTMPVTRLYVDSTCLASNTTVDIFVTSAEHVRQKIDRLFEDLIDVPQKNIVILHLGVNYRGTRFLIERCAFNDASFRIPDEAGYQPKNQLIIESKPLGERYHTTLDVDKIINRYLKEREFGSNIVFPSGDAGRFVCNYTYCYSLDKAQKWNEALKTGPVIEPRLDSGDRRRAVSPTTTTSSRREQSPKVHVLFVHVPPFQIIPEEDQMEFLYHLLDSIQASLVTDDDASTRM